MPEKTRDDRKSVKDFVNWAFPESTIPYHDDGDHRDFSVNLLDDRDWKNPRIPTGDGCHKQAPVWPADLFGLASALLEQSGAYQRLANRIRPHQTKDFDDFVWIGNLDPASPPDDKDFFGVHGHHRLVLRLIGALWRYGALIISGRHKLDGQAAGAEDILAANKKCASDALKSLKNRTDQDYSHKCIDHLENSIHNLLTDEINICGESPDIDEIVSRYRYCQISKIIIRHIQEYSSKLNAAHKGDTDCTRKEAYFRGKGLKDIGPHFLTLWARRYIEYHWNILRTSAQPISLSLSAGDGSPEDVAWWRAAMRLLIIADEAGKGMGFTGESDTANDDRYTIAESGSEAKPTSTAATFDGPLVNNATAAAASSPSASADQLKYPLPIGAMCKTIWSEYLWRESERIEKAFLPTTLTRCLNEAVGAVLPKTRTPGNGCTIRSLSHNLATLPQKGRVRARWVRQSKAEKATSYNILLVPYPFQIKSRHVAPVEPDDASSNWGFFSVKPNWLYEVAGSLRGKSVLKTLEKERQNCRKAFWTFLESLIETQDQSVDAVILPEGALDGKTFDFVQKSLPIIFPNIKMFVCGLTSLPPSYAKEMAGSKKDADTSGNFVATYLRHPDSTVKVGDRLQNGWATRHVRAKHHRWKLDAGQLESYALSHRLQPDRVWWEDIKLPPREMLFAEFSSGSVVTALICEDLARIEPCQVALRAVGPNLVLVLLMDSAQVAKRWPYQYAGVLSDDPGCSVLTLTSFGLIKRSNLSEDRDSREIAVWREPHTGRAREIKLPKGYDAQLLSIRREFCTEQTLDGRNDNGDSAIVWRFAGLTPIRATSPPPGGRADDND